ncbi:MAG TPA: MMPL family transporter [Kineosporiaceae bacterium]|nr:MMPL family transporter [Kineosporiaceae bacterium]
MLPALGRLLSRHPWRFVAAWTVLVTLGALAASGAVGEGLFQRLQPGDAPQVQSPARRGQQVLDDAAPGGATAQLLLDGVDPRSPAVRRVVEDLTARLMQVPTVLAVRSPYGPGPAAGTGDPADSPLVSTDRTALLVTAQLRAGLSTPAERAALGEVTARMQDEARRLAGARALTGSVRGITDEINKQVPEDLRTGEVVALPASLLVMILVFGGFLAAGLPLVGALASIVGALTALLGFSYLLDLDSSVVSVVTVLGLGLCIDYGLLLTSRYREELRRGPAGALERTLATAGRTVLFSGLTVAVSLAGLLVFRASILRAIGAAGLSVVLVALLVALTLVPALLALAGRRLVRPGVTQRLPVIRRLGRRLGDVPPERGAFSALAAVIQRRPVVPLVAVLAVLLIAGLPVLQLRLVSSGVALLPLSSPSRRLFDDVAARFPRANGASVTVVSTWRPEQLARWAQDAGLARIPGVTGLDPVRVQANGRQSVSVLGIRTAGTRTVGSLAVPDPTSDQARAVVRAVQAREPAGEPLWVTGQAAFVDDFLDDVRARAPYAIGVVVLATFVLLFLLTGSVLVPVKALVLVVVSLSASFGVLVWGFQQGHLGGVLDFTSTGGVETAIPVLLVALGFGLSMDYEVFLLSRIKEFHDAGLSNDEAVAAGLQRSGRIITSAALIIVVVFAGFAAGKLLVIKETGIGLAVVVAVDATLVRLILVPATMTLLGEWNWWAPGPLRRLHQRLGLREASTSA